jgi:hypothetical protein
MQGVAFRPTLKQCPYRLEMAMKTDPVRWDEVYVAGNRADADREAERLIKTGNLSQVDVIRCRDNYIVKTLRP